jgi:co-chaperonin GroES (HSP10)
LLDLDKLKMLPPYVLVRRLPPETGTGGLIILPDTQNFKNRRVEVLRTHDGHKFPGGKVVPCDVKPGDLAELIIFDGDILDKNQFPDVEICREENILAVVG